MNEKPILPGDEPQPAELRIDPVFERLHKVESLPLGYFTVWKSQNRVEMNGRVPAMLDLTPGGSGALTEDAFWKFIERSSRHPGETRLTIEAALNGLEQNPVLDIELRRQDTFCSIFLFPVLREGSKPGVYGGFVVDWRVRQEAVRTRTAMMNDLAVQARKSSASIRGKLEALEGNTGIWPKDIQEDMLREILGQQQYLNSALDLALNLMQAFDRQEVYYQRIDLAALIGEIAAARPALDIHLVHPPGAKGSFPKVQLDPALTRLAISNLLTAIEARSHPGKMEMTLSLIEGVLNLRVDSPRTMSLPGMIPDSVDSADDHPDIRLFLAQRIVTAQGGSLELERSAVENGLVSSAVISFPADLTGEVGAVKRQPLPDPPQGAGRVLLALDYPDLQLELRDAFQASGYWVDLALDGSTALDLAQRNHPDLMIIARNLPGLDGLLVTQGIRRWSAVPIMMISARTNPDDLIYAYQLGVDEYLRIPVSKAEVLAKARVNLRRSAAAGSSFSPEIYQAKQLRIDYSSRQVWIRGKQVELTPIEYRLLGYLSRHANQIIPYAQLLENVWEGPDKGTRQGLFVHIKRIREKIEIDPRNPQIISNKWGVGYVFNP